MNLYLTATLLGDFRGGEPSPRRNGDIFEETIATLIQGQTITEATRCVHGGMAVDKARL